MQYPQPRPPLSDAPPIPATFARLFFVLRWLLVGVGLAIGLYAADGANGVARAFIASGVFALYNTLYTAVRYWWVRSNRDLLLLACADAIVVAVAVGLTDGVNSPYFLFFYVIIAEASLRLTINAVLIYTTVVATDYTLGALFLSHRHWNERDLTIIMAEVVLMFVVASVSTLLARAVDEQRALARRERALSAQLNYQVAALSALNGISEQLGARLDNDPAALLRFTGTVVPALLNAEACWFLTFAPDDADPRVGGYRMVQGWRGADGVELSATGIVFDPDDVHIARFDTLRLPMAALHAALHAGHVQSLPSDSPLWNINPAEDPNAEGDYSAVAPPPLAPIMTQPALLLAPLPDLDSSESPAQTIHTLLVVQRPAAQPFDASEQEIAAALGRQLALVIKNARLYEAERRNVARLQELEQMKSNFLAAVSHELRTPLTSIKASVVLMLDQIEQAVAREREIARVTHSFAADGGDDAAVNEVTHRAHEEAAEKLLRNIDRNTDRLNALVTDLLDMTRLQHGRLKLNVGSVMPGDVVRDVMAGLRPLLDARDQSLTLDVPPPTLPIQADRRRIEQIITNLVSNASRYTPRNGHISVRVEERPDDVRIVVADNGPGIPAAEHALIFERFYRGAQHEGGRAGTGLGLAIARSLVELHGGRIWVESAGVPGAGSIFTVSLPRQPHAQTGYSSSIGLSA